MASERPRLLIARGLIRLLPRRDRDEYGEELLGTIRRRAPDAERDGRLHRARFWLGEWRGLLSGLAAAWWDRSAESPSGGFFGGGLGFDLRTVGRTLVRRRFFTVAAVGTLALGIGANAGVTSVAWRFLFSPLPLPEADRLVRLFHDSDLTMGVSLDELDEYSRRGESFAGLAGWSVAGANQATDGAAAVRISYARVTPSFFRVLGTSPMLGATFREEGPPSTAVLSHRFWLQRFGGDPSTVGRRITLDEADYRIIGVLPPGATFPHANIDLFVPFDAGAAAGEWRSGPFVDAVGRLGRGISIERAGVEVAAIASAMRRRAPAEYEAEHDFGGFVVPLDTLRAEGQRPLLAALMAAAILLFITTCVNIATLLTTRLESRASELHVRRALGGTRLALIRLHLVEALLLGGAGAAAGLLVALWVTPALTSVLAADSPWARPTPLATVGTFVLLAGAAATVLICVWPIGRALRLARSVAAPRSHAPTGLIVRVLGGVQVTLALVLVSGSVLLLQTVENLTAVDLGYTVTDRLTARLSLPASNRFDTETEQREFIDRLVDRIRGRPGVVDVGLVNALPLGPVGGSGDVYVEALGADSALDVISQRIASAGYFETMGVELLAGRGFGSSDRAGAARVAVVDELFARRYFGDPRAAIGGRIRFFFGGSEWNEIVGVVAHVRNEGPDGDEGPQVYAPFHQRPTRSVYLAVAYDGDASSLIPALQSELRTLDPGLAFYDIATMEDRLADTLGRQRFALTSFSAFAFLALLLATIGTYATVALNQRRRSREIAIRRALGASSTSVLFAIVNGGLRTVGIGIGIGLVAAIGLARLMEGLMFDVSIVNPAALLAPAGTLALAGILATILPGLRATREDPAKVLRDS